MMRVVSRSGWKRLRGCAVSYYFPEPDVGAGTEEMSVNSGLAQESM